MQKRYNCRDYIVFVLVTKYHQNCNICSWLVFLYPEMNEDKSRKETLYKEYAQQLKALHSCKMLNEHVSF